MSRIICVGAHPDDVELSMGGTILQMKKAGHEIFMLDLTNGEPTPYGSIEIRKSESEKACALLDVKRITLDIPNRYIEDSISNRKKVSEVFRDICPEYIFSHYEYDSHPDHIAASKLVDASKFYSKLTKCDIQGEPFFPKRIIYYFPNHIKLNLEPSFLVDISEHILKKKEVLESYNSQFIQKGNGQVIQETIDLNRYFGLRIAADYAEPFYSRESIGIMELGKLFL